MARLRAKAFNYLELWEKLPKNKYGQVHDSDLTDTEWNFIKEYLPFPNEIGRKRVDDRHVLNGILYFLSTAIRWNDLPKYYPSDSVCFSRLKEYSEMGIWEDILTDLQRKALNLGKLNLKNGYLDSSFAPSKKGLYVM